MKKPKKVVVSARKRPVQARSEGLVADVLEAAIRVLAREGAARFTTVRVAEEAGVSVGSLYQYFPNKESILFRLQADEWDETWEMLEGCLGDTAAAPLLRLERMVVLFFETEREEAPLRRALDDAGSLIRAAPEARAHEARTRARMAAFVAEVVPGARPAERAFLAEYVLTAMGAIGERATARDTTRAEVRRWGQATARLLVTFLEDARRQHATERADTRDKG